MYKCVRKLLCILLVLLLYAFSLREVSCDCCYGHQLNYILESMERKMGRILDHWMLCLLCSCLPRSTFCDHVVYMSVLDSFLFSWDTCCDVRLWHSLVVQCYDRHGVTCWKDFLNFLLYRSLQRWLAGRSCCFEIYGGFLWKFAHGLLGCYCSKYVPLRWNACSRRDILQAEVFVVKGVWEDSNPWNEFVFLLLELLDARVCKSHEPFLLPISHSIWQVYFHWL